MNKEGLFIIWEGPPPILFIIRGSPPPSCALFQGVGRNTGGFETYAISLARTPQGPFFSEFFEFYYFKIQKIQKVRKHRKNSHFWIKSDHFRG